MPTPRLTPEQMMKAVNALVEAMLEGYTYPKTDGTKAAIGVAADRLGMQHNTLRGHVEAAQERLGVDIPALYQAAIQKARVPEDDLPPISDVLPRVKDYHARRERKRERVKIIKVPKEPFGIAFVGDPHLDNAGCRWDRLEADLRAIRACGMRAIMMGDVLDNFHTKGKLAAKQADNPVTVQEGLALAKWLVTEAAAWDALILGNHDAWLEHPGWHLMQGWAQSVGSRFYDWIVHLRYDWGDGAYSATAAHDMPGHSIHNPLHANMRRAQADGTADAYVTAHKHNAAKASHENGFRGRHYTFLRVKGYKEGDSYAIRKGYPEQLEGHSGVIVINPHAQSLEGRARTFYDVAEAGEHLQMLRRNYGVAA